MDTNTNPNANTNGENTSPDDPVGSSEAESTVIAASTSEPSPEESGEDTGEIAEVQAEAAGVDEGVSEISPNQEVSPTAAAVAPKTPSGLPDWVQQISRYHNDMNGLLAGKENLKIMAVNKSVRPSFYKKWVHEANQFARLTVNLRHRQKRALARFQGTGTSAKDDPAA